MCEVMAVTELSHGTPRLTSKGAARMIFTSSFQIGTAVHFSKSAFDLGLLSISRLQE